MIGLPLVWFSAGLGLVSNWVTEGGRRGKTLVAFLSELPGLPLLPLAVLLAVATLGCLALYAIHPWLMRRRILAAIATPGEDVVVPVGYRFDADGIAQSTPDLDAHLPWDLVRGLDEDRDHLFVVTGVEGEPIVLAKADLTAAQAEGVRAWIAARARPDDAAPSSDETDRLADPLAALCADRLGDAGAVRLAFTFTAAERAAIVMRTLERPAMRRMRGRNAAILVLGLSLVYPGIVAFAWAVDPYRVPFPIAFPLFLEMIGTDFWQPALGAVALVALLLAVGPRGRRWGADRLGEELTAEARPDTAYALADDRGIALAQGGSWARFAWRGFGAPERVGDLVVLPLRWGSVLPLPLRAFDPEALARFDALTARHLPTGGPSA